jgi:hypothetical protein
MHSPILLSKTNISESNAGVGKFPLKVKAVAVLGRKVISVGVTVKAGITTFLIGTPAVVTRMNTLEYNMKRCPLPFWTIPLKYTSALMEVSVHGIE